MKINNKMVDLNPNTYINNCLKCKWSKYTNNNIEVIIIIKNDPAI